MSRKKAMTREEAIAKLVAYAFWASEHVPDDVAQALDMAIEVLKERPHGTWEALGFQQGYAFCRCSNCHKTMRLYLDSKNEFCCIADIRNKVVSCMYCGADMRKEGDKE